MAQRRIRELANGSERPRMMREYRLPEQNPQTGRPFGCRSVVMKELRNRDKLEIGLWVDLRRVDKTDLKAQLEAEQFEAMRYSLVQVDGHPVNQDGRPYGEMDDWDLATMRYIQAFFDDMNGVEEEDVKKAVRAGTIWTPNQSPREEDVEDVAATAG